MWDPREDSYIQELAARIEALEAAQQPQQSPEPQWHRLSDVKPSNGMQCLFRVHPNLLHSRGVWVDQSHSLTPSISPSGFYTDRGLFVGDPALIWWSAIEPEVQQPLAPPIGVKPQWLADEERLGDLQSAIKRYEDSGHPVPPQWRAEAREIIERQEQRQQPQPADHIADARKMAAPPAPAGGLVDGICRQLPLSPGEVRAVVRVVAKWLRSDGPDWPSVASLLEQEASQ
jgi:hypothetical protein